MAYNIHLFNYTYQNYPDFPKLSKDSIKFAN